MLPDPLEASNSTKESKRTPQSFKEVLMDRDVALNSDYMTPMVATIESEEPLASQEHIILSEEDKQRIHKPWGLSLIIKLFDKRLPHTYLKTKLLDKWKPTELLILVDLGCDYFVEKFQKTENLQRALHGGPWFVVGYFPSIK